MKLLPLKQTRSHVATVRRHLMVQGLTQLGWGGEGTRANSQMDPKPECKQIPATPEQQSVCSFCSSGVSSCFSSSAFIPFLISGSLVKPTSTRELRAQSTQGRSLDHKSLQGKREPSRPQTALLSRNLLANRKPDGDFKPGRKPWAQRKQQSLFTSSKSLISVSKTLAAKEVISYGHDGKGEKEACVKRM